MNKEAMMKYVKAASGILACFGIAVSPENQEAIVGGFLVLYSVFSAIQGYFKANK